MRYHASSMNRFRKYMRVHWMTSVRCRAQSPLLVACCNRASADEVKRLLGECRHDLSKSDFGDTRSCDETYFTHRLPLVNLASIAWR